MDFVAIDFETANNRKSSICQVAVVAVQNNEIVDRKSWLIKPKPYYFEAKNIEIHGIDKWHVQDCPTFAEVWDEIRLYLEGNDIISYNANFDMSVLRGTLQAYDLEPADFYFACCMNMAKKAFPKQKSYKLQEIARLCEVIYTPHRAEEDAFACAAIAVAASTVVFPDYYVFENYREIRGTSFFSRNPRISDIKHELGKHNSEHPFFGKNVVFTGDLQNMSRAEAMQRVADTGGVVKSCVSSKTDYLVMGKQDWFIWIEGYKSGKMKKAEELIAQGYKIEMINEDKLLELMGNETQQVIKRIAS